MKEVRDIKIDLVMGNQNPIVDLFKELTDGIKIINCNVYNKDGLEFIYHKNGEWIFYQDVKNKKFWCDYNRYWSVFAKKLNLEYEETQAITKFLVEEALKRGVDTPEQLFLRADNLVEEALKREVDTPAQLFLRADNLVEEALKRGVDTPYSNYSFNLYNMLGDNKTVEEALKRGVDTPYSNYSFNYNTAV